MFETVHAVDGGFDHTILGRQRDYPVYTENEEELDSWRFVDGQRIVCHYWNWRGNF